MTVIYCEWVISFKGTYKYDKNTQSEWYTDDID